MAFTTREKYKGQTRHLLLAFDIGTTFSGASYSILDPGKVPEILPVTRYPSQERAGGDIKIPTVIYYDKAGKPCVTGAETLAEGIEEDAEDNGWTKAHWFKLHLRPKPKQRGLLSRFSTLALDSEKVPPLPAGKTVVQVFADYMRYLDKCAKMYIEETHGEKLWSSLKGDIMYILTHPNGWGGPEQAQMRQAATQAGLVPDTDEGRSRVSFVTEGEASLHFCLSNGLSIAGSDENSGVLIVDAGGGTIDITSYRKLKDDTFEEIAIPDCHFQGAAYVTMRAEAYFKELLSRTRFRGDVPNLTRRFDRSTKHVFRRDDEPLNIQFASHGERDQALKIRGGRITLDGQRVATFFEPSISCIVDAIKNQQRTAHFPIKSVFLVGGFSASTWLYEKVRDAIRPLGIAVSRPDTHVNKAVANGAVSFYLDGAVRSRVARLTYGVETFINYDPSKTSHLARASLAKPHPVHGKLALYDHFSSILVKNTRIKDTTEFRARFSTHASATSGLKSRLNEILAYSGDLLNPEWMKDEPEHYQSVCIVEADTSSVKPEVSYSAKTGSYYCTISFDIILQFGLTELKAQIAYTNSDGVEQRGPARIVYE